VGGTGERRDVNIISQEPARIVLSDGYNEVAAAVDGDFIVIVVENPEEGDGEEEAGGASAITLTRSGAKALAEWMMKAAAG
jgi:hypothetical protein